MEFKKYLPGYPENKIIAYYWTLEKSQIDEGLSYRFVPDGHVEWIFHLKQPWEYRFAKSSVKNKDKTHLLGHFKHYLDLKVPKESFLLFSVKFYPWAAQSIWNINMAEATDTNISIADLTIPGIKDLLEKVYEQSDISAIVVLMNAFFKKQMAGFSESTLKNISQHLSQANTKIADCNFALSQRRIEQRFKEEIGISPKLFQRTMRINRIIQDLIKNPNPNLTQKAYDYNYTDQAHFIYDFKQFTGHSPSRFLKKIYPDGDIFNLRIEE